MRTMLLICLLAVALPVAAQSPTPVPLEVDVNPILVSVNNWLQNSALAIPIVIGLAIMILSFVGEKIADAFTPKR